MRLRRTPPRSWPPSGADSPCWPDGVGAGCGGDRLPVVWAGMDGWGWPSWLRWQAQLGGACRARWLQVPQACCWRWRAPCCSGQQQPHGEPRAAGGERWHLHGVIAAALLLPALPLPMMLLGAGGRLRLPVAAGAYQLAQRLPAGADTAVWHRHHGAVRAVAGHRPGQRRPAGAATALLDVGSTYYVTQPVALPWWCWRC